MIVRIGILVLLLSNLSMACGQDNTATIHGKVRDSTGQALSRVNILILNTAKGTATNDDGIFKLDSLSNGTYNVRFRSVVYHSVTKQVTLKAGQTYEMALTLKPRVTQMNTTVVTGTQEPSYVKASPVKVQVGNQDFLSKDPSSNLMESIEQVNGVQQQVNCGVCGTNSLRINGMAGP